MKKTVVGAFAAVAFMFVAMQVSAQVYDHEIVEKDMRFSWKVEGSDLKVKISGKTTGWVGIGFNPSQQMKDANFILGYVKDGKVSIIDHFGDADTAHDDDEKLGGSTDVTLIGGMEDKNVTTIEFSMPLNSGDKMDTVLDPEGETLVLLAYGGSRDSFKAKHQFRTSVKVRLASGEVL